jgi:hypothetical protein
VIDKGFNQNKNGNKMVKPEGFNGLMNNTVRMTPEIK